MKVSLYATSALAVVVVTVIVTAGTLFRSQSVHAQSEWNDHESRIQRGFEIAPIPLNLEGKDRTCGSHLWCFRFTRPFGSVSSVTVRIDHQKRGLCYFPRPAYLLKMSRHLGCGPGSNERVSRMRADIPSGWLRTSGGRPAQNLVEF